MEFKKIDSDRASLIELLMVADPDEDVIKQYIDEGDLIGLFRENKCLGVVHYKPVSENIVEIMNIGIDESAQGKGLGSILLKHAIKVIEEAGKHKIVLGTGNSSIGNIAFYQKNGFDLVELWRDYFMKNYKEEIYEDGIQCKHMLRFEYILTSCE